MQSDNLAKTWGFVAIVLAVTVGTAFAQTSAPVIGTQTATTSGIRAGHVLVRFKAEPGQDVLNQRNAVFGSRVVGPIAGIGVTHLQVPREMQFALVGNLRQRPYVEVAEFDSYAQALVTPNDPVYSTVCSTSTRRKNRNPSGQFPYHCI